MSDQSELKENYNFQGIVNVFSLTDAELNMNILHAYAGGSDFIATLHQHPILGKHLLVACDPIYAQPLQVIQLQAQVAPLFVKDFSEGRKEGRYVPGELAALNFKREQFDLALLANYLFNNHLDVDKKMRVILQLVEYANEVRIYPLVNEEGQQSPHLGELLILLQDKGLGVEIDSKAMLRVYAQQCTVARHQA